MPLLPDLCLGVPPSLACHFFSPHLTHPRHRCLHLPRSGLCTMVALLQDCLHPWEPQEGGVHGLAHVGAVLSEGGATKRQGEGGGADGGRGKGRG